MRVLVISPHQDDETLGAGGTLLRMREEGHELFWLNVTSPKTNYGYDAEFVNRRGAQVERVAKAYSFASAIDLGFPPASLGSGTAIADVVGAISGAIADIEPHWVIIPDGNDVHTDHKVVHECCLSCTKTFRLPSIRRVMSMEIPSETDFGDPHCGFVPNCFIDISKYIDEKIEIMKIYDTEIKPAPFPRSEAAMRSLSIVRGAAAGVEAAEGFRVIREIV